MQTNTETGTTTGLVLENGAAKLPATKPARTPRKPAEQMPVVRTPMDLIAMAVERGDSPETIGKLMDLADRMEDKHKQQAYVTAMAQFKRNPPRIEKTRKANVSSKKGEGASYAYMYANLADVCAAITARLAECGISHDWSTVQQDGAVQVTCTLTHEQGYSKSTKLSANLDLSGGKNALQGLGSAVSYLERYTLLAACGIAVDDEQDNDGASIGGDERAELQGMAADMRKDSGRAAPAGLLAIANEHADGGTAKFGPWWKSITQDQRTALLPNLDALQKKAAAVTAGAK